MGSGHGPLGRPVRRSRSKERNVGLDKSKTRPTPPSFRDQQSRDGGAQGPAMVPGDVLVARSLTASQRVCDRPVQMGWAKWASTYHTNVGPAQARHKASTGMMGATLCLDINSSKPARHVPHSRISIWYVNRKHQTKQMF